MKLNVKDPATGLPLILDAKPDKHNTELGFRISYPNGSGFFISNRLGTWRSADDHHVDPDLLVQIGLAIENQTDED